MAAPSIEDRLRRLEDAHSVHGPAHVNSPLVCNASLKHAQQISDLGNEFNNLDEALHALEQANNAREERVRKLEQQTLACQSIEVDNKALSKPNEGAEQLTNAKSNPAISALLVDLEVQKATLDNIATRLCQLEKQSAPSLSTFTTHDIAQTLLLRLGNGEDLDAMVHLQLRTTLEVRDGPPLTPAPTSTTRGESTMSAATFVEQQTKPGLGRPPKRRMDEPSDEPMQKRQRSRTSKSTSGDSLSIKSEPKRGRGRPPTHGRYARKSSSTASSSSGTAPPATMPAPRALPAKTPPKKKGTATKLTKTMLAKRIADEQPIPEAGKYWRDRVISGSTNSDASMEQSELVTPKRTIRLTGVGNTPKGDAKSDEPVAVATKSQRTATAQTARVTPVAQEATTTPMSASPHISDVSPKRKALTQVPNRSPPRYLSLMREVNSLSPGGTKAPSSPGYRDMHIHDLAALEDRAADGIDIPPERRSSRKPKAAKHFGDMVSWKEANVQVGALRPSGPSPSKW